jgi:hypothetical protein
VYSISVNLSLRCVIAEMAVKKGHEDVSTLTPKDIAIEVYMS